MHPDVPLTLMSFEDFFSGEQSRGIFLIFFLLNFFLVYSS